MKNDKKKQTMKTMKNLRWITCGASPAVHHLGCIACGASPAVHRLRWITCGASQAVVHHPYTHLTSHRALLPVYINIVFYGPPVGVTRHTSLFNIPFNLLLIQVCPERVNVTEIVEIHWSQSHKLENKLHIQKMNNKLPIHQMKINFLSNKLKINFSSRKYI